MFHDTLFPHPSLGAGFSAEPVDCFTQEREGGGTDRIACELAPRENGIYIRSVGIDRANLISRIARNLDHYDLYVVSMAFNIGLPTHDQLGMGITPYSLELFAKGEPGDLADVAALIEAQKFLETPKPESISRPPIAWYRARLFNLSLYTPDRPGITAQIAEIVGQSRPVSTGEEEGTFVHLIGTILNDGGPVGGTPYFCLKANIATHCSEARDQIIHDLKAYAKANDMERDLLTTMLPNHV